MGIFYVIILIISYIPFYFQESITFESFVDPFNLHIPHNSSFFPSIDEANKNVKLSIGTIIVFSSDEENIEIEQKIIISKKVEILSVTEKKGRIKFLKNSQFFVEQDGELIFRNFICEIDQDEGNEAVFSVSNDGAIFFHVK